ncbi:hypothetical protein [Paraglaciecola mesophila]|nr:hypothetical protein [Paraglaciecola mesophila]
MKNTFIFEIECRWAQSMQNRKYTPFTNPGKEQQVEFALKPYLAK